MKLTRLSAAPGWLHEHLTRGAASCPRRCGTAGTASQLIAGVRQTQGGMAAGTGEKGASVMRLATVGLVALLLSGDARSSTATPTPRTALPLGLVNALVVFAGEGGRSHAVGIVVRVIGQSGTVQSFGISNEAGVVVMPLPPGRYCHDAFSMSGTPLESAQEDAARCFEVKRDTVVTIGVEVNR